MAVYYFDASAVVKYDVTEPGGTWVQQLIAAQDAEKAQARHHICMLSSICATMSHD